METPGDRAAQQETGPHFPGVCIHTLSPSPRVLGKDGSAPHSLWVSGNERRQGPMLDREMTCPRSLSAQTLHSPKLLIQQTWYVRASVQVLEMPSGHDWPEGWHRA